MATINWKQGIDLPVMQQLAPLYTSNYSGAALVTDRLFTIWWIQGYGSTNFWRYDVRADGWTQLQALLTAPSTAGHQTAACYDASRNALWIVPGNSTNLQRYVVAENAWYTVNASVPVAASAGATIVHCCPTVNASGNDDYLYYTAGNGSSRKLYRYSISGNSWTELGTDVIPAACAQGSMLHWLHGFDADKLLLVRGNSTRTLYLYSLSGGTVQTWDIKQWIIVTSNGSMSAYEPTTNELIWVEGGSRNIGKAKLALTAALVSDTASSGGNTTLNKVLAGWEPNLYAGLHVTLTSGTGAGQTRWIVANTATQLTVYPAWAVNPASGTGFEIKPTVSDYGTATAGSANTLSDSGKAWNTNAYQYSQVQIIAGTGSGQVRNVASNTATQLTTVTNWSVTPDATSVYEILSVKATSETQIPYASSASYYTPTMVTLPLQGLVFCYFIRANAQTDWFRWLVTTP